MDINVNNLMQSGTALLIALGLKILEALALWISRPLADPHRHQHDRQGDD